MWQICGFWMPRQPSRKLNVLVDGNTINSNLAYTANTGYMSVTAGSRHLQVEPVNSTTPIVDTTISLGSSTNTTVIVTGITTFEGIVLTDQTTVPTSGTADNTPGQCRAQHGVGRRLCGSRRDRYCWHHVRLSLGYRSEPHPTYQTHDSSPTDGRQPTTTYISPNRAPSWLCCRLGPFCMTSGSANDCRVHE